MPTDGRSKDTKDVRRNKLSLKKKTQRDGAKAASSNSSSSSKGPQVLPGPTDLNETCEFRETVSFKTGGQLKISRGKASNVPQHKADSSAKEPDNKGKDGKDSQLASNGELVALATVGHDAVAMETVKEEELQCHVCNKALTHMSCQRRQQHVNRCMDRVQAQEQSDREQRELLEHARTAVLDCPMCGKAFKTDTARLSHLKKCSTELGVATETLLKLTKDQEAERQTCLSSGVLPPSLRNLKIKSTATSKKRKVKEPKSQYDEDVQVAMAISSSLAEQEKLQGQELLGRTAAPSDSKGPTGKKGKKKQRHDDVCLLTTLSDTDRQRRLEEKVNNILMQEGWSNTHCKDIKLLDSQLRLESDGQCRALWERSIQDSGSIAGSATTFYVDTLVPPLTIKKTVLDGGSKVRIRKIPGREVTFIEEKTEGERKGEQLLIEGEDVITASTQTAAVLAELATDDMNLHASLPASQDNPADRSLLNDTQCSGYCIQTLTLKTDAQQEEHRQALLDYRSLVNNLASSDLCVTTADGQTLRAHTLILSVRCPTLIKMAKESAVKLDASTDTVLTLLTYLYTGELTLTASSKTELQNLAGQLELPNLETLCKNLAPSTENSDNGPEKDTNGCDPEEEFTESKLDLKQIWGESDSDSDGEEEGNKVEHGSDINREDVNSEVEDEDYHAIMCTQKRLVRASSKEEDKVEDKEEMDSCKIDDSSDYREMATSDIRHEEDVNFENVKEDLPIKQVNVSSTVSDIGLSQSEKEDKDSKKKRSSGERDRCEVPKSTDVYEDSIVLSSDDEVIPSLKRARLSSGQDMEIDNFEYNKDKGNVEMKETQNTSGFSSIHSDSKTGNYERSPSEESVSVNSFNQSGADLFCSPTPVKGNIALGIETVRSTLKRTEENSVKRNLHELSQNPGNTVDSSIVLEDSGSEKSVIDEMEFENVSKPSENSGESKTRNKEEVGKIASFQESPKKMETETNATKSKTTKANFTEIKSSTTKLLNSKSPDIYQTAATAYDASAGFLSPSTTPGKVRDTVNSARESDKDDELEITGDNFEELLKGSPVFKDKRSLKAKLNTSANVGSSPNISNSSADLVQCFDDSFHDSDLEKISLINNENVAGTDGSADTTESHADKQFNGKPQNTDDEQSANEAVSEEVVEIGSEDTCSSFGQNESINLTLSQGSAVKECSFLGVRIGESASIERGEKNDEHDGKECENKRSEPSSEPDKATVDDDDDRVDHLEADVWEDFDDGGMAFIPPVESPEVVSPTKDDHATVGLENTSLQDGEDSFVFHVDCPIEGPSCEQPATSGGAKASFVTPTVSEAEKTKKTRPWVPPSPFTPMPQYDKMATPLIKQAVQKYGVKPVGKKRMIKVLQDIYQQTHAYETDSDCEELEDTEGSAAPITAGVGNAQGDTGADSEEEDLDLSQQSQTSQDSEVGDGCFEESCLHMISSDSDASPQKSADVNRQLMNYMKKNPDLHRRILMYEPLELDVLKADLKEAKVKCSMDKLMDFLDERCIAFTTKNSRNSRRGRQKKGSPKKKATAKSPKKRGRPKLLKSVSSAPS